MDQTIAAAEESGVTCFRWILLFLLGKEGRKGLKEKLGFELRPERSTEERGEEE